MSGPNLQMPLPGHMLPLDLKQSVFNDNAKVHKLNVDGD